MGTQNELIPTLTVDTHTILETMDILRQLCMKGNLNVDERAKTWQAYNTLNRALLNSPEFKAEFGK